MRTAMSQSLGCDPQNRAMIPNAVEELVRAYPIVQTVRKTAAAMEFHGCPINKGDLIAFPLAMANREPMVFRAAARSILTPLGRVTSFSARGRTAAWAPIWHAKSSRWPSRSGID